MKKVYYGLKQSLHACFRKFNSAISQVGRKISISDHTIFIKQRKQGVIIFLSECVFDVIIVIGDCDTAIVEMKQYLGKVKT